MQPVIDLFGKSIPVYGIFYCLGIGAAALCAIWIARGTIPGYEVVYSAVYAVIGGVIGAKLLFIAVSLRKILEMELSLLSVFRGGFVFYGGVMGGAIGLFWYCRQFRLSFFSLADLYAVCLPIGHALGRLGCHFAGCCYGMAYNGPFSVTYHATLGDTPLETPLLPIQLMEAVCLAALFLVLAMLYRQGFSQMPGRLSGLYAVSYALLRFVLEFFRGDLVRGAFWGLSTSQWISLGLFAVGIFLLSRRRKA